MCDPNVEDPPGENQNTFGLFVNWLGHKHINS